jgi:16S rRNA (adenine1518-N6/adenine1519-N6)-dimethyltransferase
LEFVKPKKQLGQHFLRNEAIAKQIAGSLTGHGGYNKIIEIGPGTGVLSKYLIQEPAWQWWGIDVDKEAVDFMKRNYPSHANFMLETDFLKFDLNQVSEGNNIAIIGNFPYNISSQILFKILENRGQVTEMVGMFQKEVAKRVVSGPNGKVSGILSIFCQAYYDVEYLFQVDETDFFPPPKVKSAVIRFKRNSVSKLDCDEKLFFSLVKIAFNQRRKTLRNALKSLNIKWEQEQISEFSGKRAEQLYVADFVKLVQSLARS